MLTLIVMICLKFSNFAAQNESTPIPSFLSSDSGLTSFDPNPSINVESPEDTVLDSSLANEETDVTQFEKVANQVIEVSEKAATIVAPQEFSGSISSSLPGSAEGTGSSPLGSPDDANRRGSERERRWIVEFVDKGDLKNYAAQLDFFAIEVGALFPAEAQLVRIEQEFGGHVPSEIRRTYFRVRKAENGYEFFVQKQLLK